MSRFWLATAVLIAVNFATPDSVDADGALKHVEISEGINPKRRIGIPGTIERGYSWKFENQDYTALIAIDTKWYNRTRSHKRRHKRQYNLDYLPPIVSEGTNALQDLVRAFNRIIPRTWNAERRVNFVLSFVHTLPYTKDITTGYDEYYKYATETLVESGGDCEDTSILFASILRGLDFEVALIYQPGHLAVGVKGNFRGVSFPYKGNRYYYCETTGARDWRLGELPPNPKDERYKYQIMPITRGPVKPIPVEPITHASPSEVSIGETTPLTLDLISSKGPQQIRIYYTIYDKDSKELEQHNQEMRLSPQQPESSTKIYDVDLPPQKRVGLIKYYIEVKYDNGMAFRDPREQSRYYQISIVDDKPPTISVLSPDDGEQFTADQQITFRAEVMDNSVVEEVHIYVLSPNDQSRKLSGEGSSDMYTMDISFSQVGTVEYYLTATDEAGKESRSENRRLTIIPPDTTSPTIRLIKPSRTTFEVDQQIPIEAKVTDGSSVKQVRLFYSFSPSRHFSHYFDRFLTETSSDTYTGHIPPQSKVGYIEYYLTATDEAGNESISEPRQIDIRPPPPPRPVTLDKGIKLYEQAKYNEAIEALQLAIRELEDLEQQGEAYLHLGGAKRGSGASNDEVKEEFRKAIRLNPNQKLPVRVGNDHPIFVELLEEVRIELIGESIIVEHDSPSSISVGEKIPLTLNLISSIGPQQVKIYYTIYDNDGNELEQNNQEMHARDRQTTSSTWIYSVGLPPQKRIGSIEYYIEIEYDNHVAFRYPRAQSRYYQISILDGKPPTISVLSPRDGERFTVGDQTTVRAQVIDNSVVEEVRIYFLAPNDRNQKLFVEGSSDVYATADITLSQVGIVEYYLTATDEAGNERKSDSRHIDIRLKPSPPPRPPGGNGGDDQSGGSTEGGTSEDTDGPIIEEKDNSPPTISLLYPPEDTPFTVNEQITIRAKVRDDTAVKEVLVHFSSSNSQTMSEEGSSGMYAMDISFSRAGSVEYYLTATDEAGNERKSESRQIKIEESVVDPPPRPPPIYQGIWASVAADNASISGSEGSYMLRVAYLREGKTHPTLGAQLDFSPDRTNMSAMFQWGPALGESDVAFTLLGGIAAYEDSPRSTHITPILGAGLRFYPRDKIVIDATSSIQFRQGFDTISLYHYEVGIRFYITRELGLRAGYGKLSLGDEDVTTLQIGLGYTF